jgi:hypothetical protein
VSETVLNWVLSGTVLSVFAGVLGLFYRSAVNAHKQRADEWYAAWKVERQISAENGRQVTTVVSAVERAAEEAS